MFLRKACVDFVGLCFMGGVKENLAGKLLIFLLLYEGRLLEVLSLYTYDNISTLLKIYWQ